MTSALNVIALFGRLSSPINYPLESKCTGNYLYEDKVILQSAIFVSTMCGCLIRNYLIQTEDSSLKCRSDCCTSFDKFELANKHINSIFKTQIRHAN